MIYTPEKCLSSRRVPLVGVHFCRILSWLIDDSAAGGTCPMELRFANESTLSFLSGERMSQLSHLWLLLLNFLKTMKLRSQFSYLIQAFGLFFLHYAVSSSSQDPPIIWPFLPLHSTQLNSLHGAKYNQAHFIYHNWILSCYFFLYFYPYIENQVEKWHLNV